MPVMPENWVHYIGIDLRKPEKALARMKQMSQADLEKIAKQGREWALTHYSPTAVAKRFLDLVSPLDA